MSSSPVPARRTSSSERDVDPSGLRIAYACNWWRPRPPTWSYTAASLRRGFDGVAAEVVDIEAQRPEAVKAALALAFRAVPGRSFQLSAQEQRRRERSIARQVRRLRPDAVVGIADCDHAPGAPTFPFQDMSVGLAAAHLRSPLAPHVNLPPTSARRLEQLVGSTDAHLREAAGVFAFSAWSARDLVERVGVDPARILVTHAGLNSPPAAAPALPRRTTATRVAFVGVDFVRKGGDATLDAVEQLRRDGHDLALTVAGPTRWPLDRPPPAWVDFRGPVPRDQIGALLREHDLFAMPSRFEAYGIAVVEALVAGLPVVTSDAFALPELVEDGVTGRLVAHVDGPSVAAALSEVLADRTYAERVADRRADLLRKHDWRGIAGRMTDFIATTLRRGEP